VDNTWHTARLGAEVGLNTWRMWRVDLDLSPGEHELAVRATDRTGETQVLTHSPPAPDGATGWHTISITAK
jgi:hypothetical protein